MCRMFGKEAQITFFRQTELQFNWEGLQRVTTNVMRQDVPNEPAGPPLLVIGQTLKPGFLPELNLRRDLVQ